MASAASEFVETWAAKAGSQLQAPTPPCSCAKGDYLPCAANGSNIWCPQGATLSGALLRATRGLSRPIAPYLPPASK